MSSKFRVLFVFLLILLSLTLTACSGPSTILVNGTPQPQSTQVGAPCDVCDQATQAAAQTQDQISANNQAASTAEIVRADAQAALNSANATLNVAQTQDQNSANVIAAQIAATSKIERANALATLNSAGSTQSAAQTQDAIQQTQIAGQSTTNAEAILNQQDKDAVAASTQTAVANNIATQTQAAVISQGFADQARQNAQQAQGPLGFIWMWCLPIFIVLLGALALWGVWRWLKIQQANQRILEKPAHKLETPPAGDEQHHQYDSLPSLDDDVVDRRYHLTKPDDQVGNWRDEVKRKLQSDEKENEDENTDK